MRIAGEMVPLGFISAVWWKAPYRYMRPVRRLRGPLLLLRMQQTLTVAGF
jgi:hypothetical protein